MNFSFLGAKYIDELLYVAFSWFLKDAYAFVKLYGKNI